MSGHPAPFTEGFVGGPGLTHAGSLALRLPGVPPSACQGVLVFRRFARPGWSNTPEVYRCAQCGDVLARSERDGTVLWVERTNHPDCEGPDR